MCNQLKTSVRVLLSSVHQLIQKLPAAKQDLNKLQMQQIVKKYNPDIKEDLQRLEKDLQYKLNFLKLAYPNILSRNPDEPKTNPLTDEPLYQLQSNDTTTAADANTPQTEEIKVESGKYIMKDGKLVKGEAAKREHVDWSNWFAANVDPEDLKRHKDLMDRQHFGGPVWKNKPMPKSILDEDSPVYEPGEKELNPYIKREKEAVFENVKR